MYAVSTDTLPLMSVFPASVCETKFCGIIDQCLFYIDLTVHYIQNFEYLT
jgi:hypothetical protein